MPSANKSPSVSDSISSRVSRALRKAASKKFSAFTLVELIVVITILAILATIGFLALSGYSQDAKDAAVKANVRSVMTAISTESALTGNSPRYYVVHESWAALSDGAVAYVDGSPVTLTGGQYGEEPKTSNYSAGNPNWKELKLNPDKFRFSSASLPGGTAALLARVAGFWTAEAAYDSKSLSVGAVDAALAPTTSGRQRSTSFFQVTGTDPVTKAVSVSGNFPAPTPEQTASGATAGLVKAPTGTGALVDGYSFSGSVVGDSWSNSDAPAFLIAGEQVFTTVGNTTWTVPAGVTKVSVVCIWGWANGGGNGWDGGGGWELRYANDFVVTPGSSVAVSVGAGGNEYPYVKATKSSFGTGCLANPGNGKVWGSGGTGQGGGNGGNGGNKRSTHFGGGGGWAGGYAGNGGDGGNAPLDYSSNGTLATAWQGGGGGGGWAGGGITMSCNSPGCYWRYAWAPGGGTNVYWIGNSWFAGAYAQYGTANAAQPGEPGSLWGFGLLSFANDTGYVRTAGTAGMYGAGGGGGDGNSTPPQSGAQGAVRVIWGTGVSFPSAVNAGNIPCFGYRTNGYTIPSLANGASSSITKTATNWTGTLVATCQNGVVATSETWTCSTSGLVWNSASGKCSLQACNWTCGKYYSSYPVDSRNVGNFSNSNAATGLAACKTAAFGGGFDEITFSSNVFWNASWTNMGYCSGSKRWTDMPNGASCSGNSSIKKMESCPLVGSMSAFDETATLPTGGWPSIRCSCQ